MDGWMDGWIDDDDDGDPLSRFSLYQGERKPKTSCICVCVCKIFATCID